jgi:iron complex transport system ATP-binding protein
MLNLENISFKIGSKVLLNNITATFKPGKMNLIVGPNGAGKSTLIKCLSKQLEPSAGKIYVGLEEMSKLSLSQLSKIRAVLSQNIVMAFPLKVWEVVMMGRYAYYQSKPTRIDEQACSEAMRFFDVIELADRNYLTLSGGEKQRVHFARVLAQIWFSQNNECRYLLLDEPLTFLDIHYQIQFMQQLQKLLKSQNLVVVGVVHDLNLAARFADTILLLDGGSMLASGTPKEVLTSQNIQTAFQLKASLLSTKELNFFYLHFEV